MLNKISIYYLAPIGIGTTKYNLHLYACLNEKIITKKNTDTDTHLHTFITIEKYTSV